MKYVGIVAGVLLVFGIIISITLCIGFCCRRCCLNFSKKGTKTSWFIIWIVIFVVITLLCLFVIIFSIVNTVGQNKVISQAKTTINADIPNAMDEIVDVISPLPAEIRAIIDNAAILVRDNAFQPADDLVAFAFEQVDNLNGTLNTLQDIVNRFDQRFNNLRGFLDTLGTYQTDGYITGVPDSSTVPDVTTVTGGALDQARVALDDLRTTLVDLNNTLDDARGRIDPNSTEINDAFNTVNTTIQDVISSIESFKVDFVAENYASKIDDYTPYISLQNKIRLPVMIILSLLTIGLCALWFLGYSTGGSTMLVGFWWFAGAAWLLMLLAVVHIALFIPINDACRNRDTLIRNAVNTTVGSGDYAASFGITSPPEAVDTVNRAVQMVLDDPDLILDCRRGQTLVTVLDLDIPEILDVRNQVDDAFDQIRDQASSFDIQQYVDQANDYFRDILDRIDSINGNIDSFNTSINDYLVDLDDVQHQIDANYSKWWNETSQTKAENLLDEVNTKTAPDTFDFFNISTMDPAGYDPADETLLTDNQNMILNLIQLNQTANGLVNVINATDATTDVLQDLARISPSIISDLENLVNTTWARLNASVDLPQQVADIAIYYLNASVDDIIELARLEDLGDCGFVGDAYRGTLGNGVCRADRKSVV